MNAYLHGTYVLGALADYRVELPTADEILGAQVVADLVGAGDLDAFKAWQEVRTSRFRDRDIDRLRTRGLLPPDLIDQAMDDLRARHGVVGIAPGGCVVEDEEVTGYGSHQVPIGPWWRKGLEELLSREEIVGTDSFGPWWARGFDPFYEVDLSDIEPQEDEYFVKTPSGGVRKVLI